MANSADNSSAHSSQSDIPTLPAYFQLSPRTMARRAARYSIYPAAALARARRDYPSSNSDSGNTDHDASASDSDGLSDQDADQDDDGDASAHLSDSEATISPPPDSPALDAQDPDTNPTTPNLDIDGSSSPLSSLSSKSPSPTGVLADIAWRAEARAKYGPLCECKGWCGCKKYKYFTGSEHHPEVRAGGDGEPSQTHLSEAVLAAWQPVESGMRSTMEVTRGRKRKVGDVKAEEKENEEMQAEFVWDRERLGRAPVGWAGDEWEEGRVAKRVATEAVGVKREDDAG